MNHQTSHPPSDMDQNETTPSVKCWTAFRHPPSQDLVFDYLFDCLLRKTLDGFRGVTTNMFTRNN